MPRTSEVRLPSLLPRHPNLSGVSIGYLEHERSTPISEKIKRGVIDTDVFGLILLSAGVALFLLPLTLANGAKGRWYNRESKPRLLVRKPCWKLTNPSMRLASMIAMIVLGPIFLIAFAIYEWKFSPKPVAPGRFLRNPSVVIASLIGFFDFVSRFC